MPPRSTASGRRANRLRLRRHRAEALQVWQHRAPDSEDHADEEQPPAETRTPGPGASRRWLRGSPEPRDREGPDVCRRCCGGRDDGVEEGEQGYAEYDQAENEQI